MKFRKNLKSGQKTAKPKFSKIRQKSNFAPILLGRISKFSEEQDLPEKQCQISLTLIFKFARFIMADLFSNMASYNRTKIGFLADF